MTRIPSAIISAAIAFSALPAIGQAADLVPADEPVPVVERMAPEWSFEINPLNGWLPGFKGDTRVFGVDASVDITAWDLIENLDELLHALDGFYQGSGEFRYGQFGFQ